MRVIDANVQNQYSYEAMAHFERMEKSDDYTLYDDLNTLITGLVADGLWSVLDDLCVYHDGSSSNSLLGLKGVQDSSHVGTINFDTRGFLLGNGVYVNTGIKDDGVFNINDNSQVLFAHHFLHSTSATPGTLIGSTSTSGTDGYSVIRGLLSASYIASLDGSNTISVGFGSDDTGITLASITATNRQDARHNSTSNSATGSTTLRASLNDIYVGAINDQVGGGLDAMTTTMRTKSWGAGGGMSAAQLTSLESRISTYLAARV